MRYLNIDRKISMGKEENPRGDCLQIFGGAYKSFFCMCKAVNATLVNDFIAALDSLGDESWLE